MKGWMTLGLAVMAGASLWSGPATAAEAPAATRITISGAWALYPLAVRWGEEYKKVHANVSLDISAGGAGKGMADALAGAVDIGMVSRDVSQAEVDKGALPFAMAIDAVIPMINAKNPELAALQQKGVKREVLRGLWTEESAKAWGTVTGSDEKAPVRVYTRSDACGAAETWAKYLGGKQEDLKGVGVYGDPGLAEAVRKDVLGIGYNNVNFAYDTKTGKPIAGLLPLPLDVNGNGVLDKDESFYGTRDELLLAIREKRFPSPPARALFFVTKGKPGNPQTAAFIRWALTDGQVFVPEAGYIQLPAERLATEVKKLGE